MTESEFDTSSFTKTKKELGRGVYGVVHVWKKKKQQKPPNVRHVGRWMWGTGRSSDPLAAGSSPAALARRTSGPASTPRHTQGRGGRTV